MSDDITIHDDFQARMNWGLWWKILRFATPYQKQLWALAIVAILTAASDIAVPLLTGRIIDQVTIHRANANLTGYGIAFIIVLIVFSICVLAFILLAGKISTSVCYDIRKASFERLQELSFSYYDRRPVGWIMARLTSDCNGLSRIIGWAMMDLVWGSCMLVGTTTVMLWIHWKLALAVLVITPPLLWICRFYQLRLLFSSRAVRKANSHVTAGFNEGIMGIRTTKSLVREQQNLEEFQSLSTTMYDHSVSNTLYAAAFLPCMLTLCSAGVGLALWVGGVGVIGGSISIGTLVIFIAYATQLSGPIEELARTITLIQGAQASAERIQQILDTEPQIADAPPVLEAIERTKKIGRDNGMALDGMACRIDRVEFRHASFAYEKGVNVLEDFNLTVERGQMIALVGPTGGGKSTIINLICRFYEPTEGRILINGMDYRRRSLHWLQSNLGMVLQTPHLFSGTIQENIRYGRLDASDDEVERAASLVNAHEFIVDMDEGYHSQVGEGGNQLSTGQKQLISLARAILADPQIVVMDEATSSVDTQTERLIQDGLNQVLSGRMAFVIAHRLSTIYNADRILVIDGGRIVEEGDHEDLIRHRGYYFDVYTNQFEREKGISFLTKAAELQV